MTVGEIEGEAAAFCHFAQQRFRVFAGERAVEPDMAGQPYVIPDNRVIPFNANTTRRDKRAGFQPDLNLGFGCHEQENRTEVGTGRKDIHIADVTPAFPLIARHAVIAKTVPQPEVFGVIDDPVAGRVIALPVLGSSGEGKAKEEGEEAHGWWVA